jgi:hypothetical protein
MNRERALVMSSERRKKLANFIFGSRAGRDIKQAGKSADSFAVMADRQGLLVGTRRPMRKIRIGFMIS